MNPQLSRHWKAQTSAIALASLAWLIGCGSKVSIGTQSVDQPSSRDGSAQAGDEVGNNHAPSAPDGKLIFELKQPLQGVQQRMRNAMLGLVAQCLERRVQ